MLRWPDPPIYDEEQKQGCGVPQIAMAYLLEEPGVASLIIGARRQTQLIEDLPAADLPDSRLADADGRALLAEQDDEWQVADLRSGG